MGLINNYAEATPSLSDKLIGTDVSNDNTTSNFLISDVLDLLADPTGAVIGSFYSNAAQNLPTASNDIVTLTLNNTESYNSGFSFQAASTSNIICENTGVYRLTLNLNIDKASSASATPMLLTSEIWLNGAQLPLTKSAVSLVPNTLKLGCNFEFILSLTENDYFYIIFRSDSTFLSGYRLNTGSYTGTGQTYSARLMITRA
jgi:hypothetical protein